MSHFFDSLHKVDLQYTSNCTRTKPSSKQREVPLARVKGSGAFRFSRHYATWKLASYPYRLAMTQSSELKNTSSLIKSSMVNKIVVAPRMRIQKSFSKNSQNFQLFAIWPSSNSERSESKEKVVSITYEEIGLFPRSFNRVFDRFLKQIFSDVENLVLQEYRFYRYLFLTTLKTLFLLFFVPFLVNLVAKNYLIRPLTEYFWNSKQPEIFLNAYQQKRAFTELQEFEETLFFESLISSPLFDVEQTLKSGHENRSTAFFGREQQDLVKPSLFPSTFPNTKSDRSLFDSIPLQDESKQLTTLQVEHISNTEPPMDKQKQTLFDIQTTMGDLYPSLNRDSRTLRAYSFQVDSINNPNTLAQRYDLDYAYASTNDLFYADGQKISQSSNKHSSMSLEPFNLVEESQNPIKPNRKTNTIFRESNPETMSMTKKNESVVNQDLFSSPFQKNKKLLNNQPVLASQEQSPSETSAAKLQEKTLKLAIWYNKNSIEAITNILSDFLSFLTLIYLLISLEIQINVTKSFLLEVFFGLEDSKKSLLILLITDLLVGYHSPNLWEFFFESIFNHYGIPESQTVIFLMVATLPVLLDVLFKYLIFRHLNRSSPATVATYHAMIE